MLEFTWQKTVEQRIVIFLCLLGSLGFYMMANTGANILPPGKTAVLTSPVHQGITKCVHFWYHIGGENPGKKPSHTETHT